MSEMELEELIEKVHNRNAAACRGTFVTRAGVITIACVILGITATAVTGAVVWANNTQAKIAVLETNQKGMESKIDGVGTRVSEVNNKMDRVLLLIGGMGGTGR
jgi:hypothetical protein